MGIKNNLVKTLKILDIYPQTFELNINGKGKKKTAIGGIISMLTVVILILIFFFSFYDYIRNRVPTIYQKNNTKVACPLLK